MEQLIEALCYVDLVKEGGVTSLHITTQQGQAAVTQLLLATRCNIHLQNVESITALQVAQRMGHTAIVTLIQNTKQQVAKNVVRQAEEVRSSLSPECLVTLLTAVPDEDWCSTWAACRTIMLRRT